jgi:hypothetical protein
MCDSHIELPGMDRQPRRGYASERPADEDKTARTGVLSREGCRLQQIVATTVVGV